MITITDALADPDLLGPHFAGPSWDRWRAVLRAAEGLPLDAEQRRLFAEVAEREPPPGRVRELWVKAGRRAGKDSIASAIATVAALGDYSRFLRPGERASILCLAVDRDQAKIVHRYIAGYFRSNPLLAQFVQRETDDGLELSNGVEIVVATNSYRAVRGRTIVCCILDECAFWRDENSASPDVETYHAVLPGLVTLPGAMLVGISTPYRRAGLLYQKWTKSYGKDDPAVLVVGGASRLFNPLLPQEIVDDALARDREAAAAEWLAEWRSDISDFIDRELLDAAIDAGVAVRPPAPGVRYGAFADPSGGRGDSFTAAIAHRERDSELVMLDSLYERKAPFDPSIAVGEIAALLGSYGLREVTGDRYAAAWVSEAFAKVDVAYTHSERDRSAIYLDALPLFAAGRVRLLDNARLAHQIASLERRASRTGRDRVDHPLGAGSHDDLANSACGALVNAGAKLSGAALWAALADD
jgi:hypothetical protein